MIHRLRFLVVALAFALMPALAPAATLTISPIPTYGTTEDLVGTVSGVTFSTHRVACYVYVGGWYTKPTFATPTVAIDGAGNWTADITTGVGDINSTRIAAYLIPDSVTPPQANGESVLPSLLAGISLASQIVYRGNIERLVTFGGHEWLVKKAALPVGPGPNIFSDDPQDVFVDSQGLHLAITHRTGSWTCAETILQANLGYGTYFFQTTGRLDTQDSNMVAGFFTWDSSAPGAAAPYREFDIEFARWGNGADPTNMQYVVQPYDTAGNLVRETATLSAGAQNLTCTMKWSASSIEFRTYYGLFAPPSLGIAPLASSWNYTNAANIPTPGEENFRINYWLFNGSAPISGVGDTLLVRDFQFLTSESAVGSWTMY